MVSGEEFVGGKLGTTSTGFIKTPKINTNGRKT